MLLKKIRKLDCFAVLFSMMPDGIAAPSLPCKNEGKKA